MKYHFIALIFSIVLFRVNADSHWNIKDGAGSLWVRDFGNNGLNGRIIDSSRCTWAREDDRGFFLNFTNGGAIRVENSRKLCPEEGVVIDIHFSCDLEAIGENGFASLISKGDPASGYAVLVGKNGELLLDFHGIDPERNILPLGLKSNVDYRLQIIVINHEHKVKINLDGKKVAEYLYKGDIHILEQPLFIGSTSKHPFTGNIYDVKIKAYGEKIDRKQHAIIDFVPQPVIDPAGTVVLSDFTKFSPQELIRYGKSTDIKRWRWRITPWSVGNNYINAIQPPIDINSSELSIEPGLTGKYDVYLAIRCYTKDTRIQMKIGNQSDYYTITAAGLGDKHRSIEVLVQKEVEMEGIRLYLAAAGLAHVECIKLIPSNNRRKNEVLDPAGSVSRGPRLTQEEVDDFLQKQIDKLLESGFFIERTYVENKKAPVPSAASEKRGYQLFNRNWMDLLFAVNVPSGDTGEISLKTAAAQGEFEPLSFGVRGLRDVPQLTLKQKTEFKGANGKTAAVKVKIGVVEAIVKRLTNYTGSSEVMNAPQYIENTDCLELKAGESRQFWLTLQPGENAEAGVYQAVFELSDGKVVEKIPVELEVYPFKLDKPKKMDIAFFNYNEECTPEEIEGTVADMAKHGCTSLVCRGHMVIVFKGDTPESFTIDWENSILPLLMEAFRKYGMNGRVQFLLPGACQAVEKRFPKQWLEVYTKILKEIEAKRKSEDWPEFIYWSFDEVLTNTYWIPYFIEDVKLQKELGLTTVNDHIWYKTSRPHQEVCDQVAPLTDIFVNRFSTKNFWYVDTWKKMMKRCRKEGKELIPYNSNNAIAFAQPAASRYSFGWFARTAGKGITGHFIYTYRLNFNDPYNDFDGVCTDWVFQYPSLGERKGGPSLDWEAYREGIDDLRYIQTLENLIAEAEKQRVDASQAKQLLSSLAASFDMEKFYKESRFIDPKWDKSWEDDSGQRFASGRFNVPNGWELEDYDLARRKIAREIINLREALNKNC